MASLPKTKIWAVCLILAAVGVGTLLAFSSRAGLAALFQGSNSPVMTLYETNRLIYPRLSMPQAYQPCRPEAEPGLVMGYECPKAAVDPALLHDLNIAESSLRRGSEPSSETQDFDSLWLLRIAMARKGQHISLAEGLEAEARSAKDAGRWVDTSAAFYLAATTEDLPRLLSPALAASDSALAIDPSNPSAAFNRALILETLALRTEAQEAWRSFLALEGEGSRWKSEAQQHLNALSVPSLTDQWGISKQKIEAGQPITHTHLEELVTRFASPVRDWIEFESLPMWVQAFLHKEITAPSRSLETATTLANALETKFHEGLPAEEIRDLNQALSGQSMTTITSLARAILGLRDARASYIRGEYQSTLNTLAGVERELGTQKPAILYWVRYYQAASLDQQGFKPAASKLLTSLIADLEGKPFPSLRARSQALYGRIKNNLGQPEEAIYLLTSAIGTLDSVRDAENGAWARTLLGDSYRLLGDFDSCWALYYVALHQIENLGAPLRELSALNAMSDFLLSAGDARLALYYQNAAVSLGPRLGNPSFFADVLIWRALLLYLHGKNKNALIDLEQARYEADQIADPFRQERFRADLSFCRGLTLLDLDPGAALAALGEALHYYEATEHWSRVLLSLEARALAHDRLRDRTAEMKDLERARDLYVRVGHQLQQDTVRISFAGRIENAFELTLRLQLEESLNAQSSFALVEQERALNHPLLAQGSWLTEPVNLRELFSALDPKTALLEYAVLSDRLLVWLVLNGQVSVYVSTITKEQIRSELRDFLLDWTRPQWRAASASLGEVLLGKVQPELARSGITSLIVVPDDELLGIPFAALTLPDKGRLLIEEYALTVNPSASLFTRAAYRQRNGWYTKPTTGRVVVVANPTVDQSIWQHLPRLDGAFSEGSSIQKFWPGNADLLTGDRATVNIVKSYLPHATWLHFAGHATALPRRPLDSYMILSSSPEHSGRLTGTELLTWDLSHLRGVVLSACRSAAPAYGSWPGAITLARPFLAKGVPLVIGSLWDIGDRESADFFRIFYRQLARHGSASRAFHESQLEALAASGRDQINRNGWVAFQLFGAPDAPIRSKGE